MFDNIQMSRMEAAFSVLLRADAKTTRFNIKFFDTCRRSEPQIHYLIPLLNQINKSKIRSKIVKTFNVLNNITTLSTFFLERRKSWPFLSSHKQHCVTFKLPEGSKKQATFNFGFGEGGIEGTQVVFPKQRPLVI